MSEAEEMLTVAAAAEVLGVHPQTLREWERDPKVPLVARRTPGGHRRFRRGDVEAFRDNVEVSS